MAGLDGIHTNLPQNQQRWSQQTHAEEDFAVGSADAGAPINRQPAESGNPAYLLSLSKEAREMLRRQRAEL